MTRRLFAVAVVAVLLAPHPAEARGVTPTAARLDCVGHWETERGHPYRSGYGAVSRGGRYHGRYQFDRRTWFGAVSRAGHPEWRHHRASEAPPRVQDDAAGRLMAERGFQPWSRNVRRWCR